MLAVWAAFGVAWATGQFVVSEFLFQVAEAKDADLLYELSDLTAWPAGWIYGEYETIAEAAMLRRIQDSDTANPEQQRLAKKLLTRNGMNPGDYWDLFYKLEEETGEDSSVSMAMEYVIYAGVCIAWGSLLGLGGFVLTMLFLPTRQVVVDEGLVSTPDPQNPDGSV